MGITKTDIFNEQQNLLASTFKVLGHPARIAILQYIIDQKACICTNLVNELGLAQATISQHLKELKSINLIQGSIEGKSICYCINETTWQRLENLLQTFLQQNVKTINGCQ